MYPSPFNSVPTGTLLGGCPRSLDVALGVVLGDEGILGVFEGDGVKGVEKGCAAEVEVAGGGLSGWSSLEAMERGRRVMKRRSGGDSSRVQRRQIMLLGEKMMSRFWLEKVLTGVMPRRPIRTIPRFAT